MALPRFKFPDGKYTAAGALRQLFLSEIQLLAAAFEPLAEMRREVFLARRKAGCFDIASVHFPDLIAAQSRVTIYFVVRTSIEKPYSV
jgi:hypothetical protein